MENELLDILKGLGLTEKESKVYLACTEIGTAVVSEIASKAKINRVTAYDILDKLKNKGLVSHYTKKKTKYFNCTNPESLLELFEKRTNDLRVSIPKFKRLTGEINHPRVRYFEGLEGIKAIYADSLSSKTEILNFSNSEEIRKQWSNYDKEYVEKRAKKKIFLKGICPKDKEGEKVHSQDKKYHREFRLIPSDQFDFTNEINIYDDKVSIISFKDELIGMIIESHEIANSQRAIFNMCWQFSEVIESLNIKDRLLKPLSDKELSDGLKKEVEEIKKVAKDTPESNLSLF